MSETDNDFMIRSYRYLRLALVITTLTLGISLVIEIIAAGCYQGSISAFYYTPVHSVFIGVLFVIGVSLVALLGRDHVEDLFFNLAGFLAPVVALVPTERPGDLCGPTERLLTVPNTLLVKNNTVALFLGFTVAFLAAAKLAGQLGSMSRPNRAGLGLSAAVLAIGLGWYLAWNDVFLRRAHGAAAVAMFVAIWLAVMVNADFPGPIRKLLAAVYRWLAVQEPSHSDDSVHATRYRPWYRATAVVMALAGVVLGIAVWAGVSHAVFWLEVAEIVPFAGFWLLQSIEGWDSGSTAPAMVTAAA